MPRRTRPRRLWCPVCCHHTIFLFLHFCVHAIDLLRGD